MASTGENRARGSRGNGAAAAPPMEKNKIKKLTADKIRENLPQITRKNGEIDLTSHGIETIISLDGLQHATKLMLSHNKLTKLSDMKRVQNITMLKLIDNKLNGEGLAELQHLKKLVILNVAENQIARIPVEVLRNLRTLKALMLNNNSITTLEWLPKFPELNSLIVSHNRISQFLPRTIDRLPALTKISISHNLLEEIPDLSALTEITELRLSHNKIKKIPYSLAKLKNLRVLELGHNEIDDWEGIEALGRLENLKQLSLSGNPIVGQPLAVDPTKKSKKSKKSKKKKQSSEGDDEDAESDSSDSEDEEEEEKLTEEEKKQRKEAKKLDAKHKQYNFKMKRIFPKLVIRDGQRILDKKTHGYVAPPKEEKPKEKKRKHEDKKDKKEKSDKKKDKKEATSEAVKEPKEKKRKIAEPTPEAESGVKPAKHKAEKLAKAKKESTSSAPSAPEAAVVAAPETAKVDKKKDKKKDKKEDKKKKSGKEDKKKSSQRQPKDLASGVLAVKQFKKHKQQDKGEQKAVDISKVNFTPNVGMGGSSAVSATAAQRTSTQSEIPNTASKMAQNPLTAFIGSFMAPKNALDDNALTHLSKTAEGAQWRLEDDAPAHRPKGYHQQAMYTSPEGFPEVPRRYTMPSHSKDQDYETYAANSYSSAIAIQELLKKRGF